MKKPDLNRIPNWKVGKWYFYNGQWMKMERTDLVGQYPLYADCFLFAKDGKFNPNHKERDLLEPWEALEMYPECKDTAPDGVDWSVPESIEPDGIQTPEAKPLPEDLFEQNRALLARNAELKTTCDRLQYFEAENKELKTENERLEAVRSDIYLKSMERAEKHVIELNSQKERINTLESDLAQAKILIADWAIKLKYYGEL